MLPPYGVGAVLSHEMADGSERPIAYASRTLSKPERGYSQLDKEALAVIFAVKKFHQFLYDQHFIIYTDHKPLLGLLNPGKSTPLMASSKMQRWALTLLTYEYELIYRPGRENGNADTLSRLPLPDVPQSTPVPGDIINLMENINASPVDALKVKQWTARDPVLPQVMQFVLQGWPPVVEDAHLQPYFTRRNELSVQAGCLLWGSRVIVPPQGREEVMNILHDSHPGIVRMKGIARRYVWWPKMDSLLEERVKNCQVCQAHRKTPAPAEKLRTTFATHGLPEVLVSDNGSVFTSEDFKVFTRRNGIRHVTSAPYHPSSNGLVERAV